MRKFRLGFAVVAAAATLLAGGPALAAPEVQEGYIVMLKDGAVASDRGSVESSINSFGGSVSRRYTHLRSGFAAKITASNAAALRLDPRVAIVEKDQIARASDVQTPTPSWGLDRLDQSNTSYDSSFTYPANPGAGVRVYIVDTGVNAADPDFTGRIVPGYDAVDGTTDGTTDCHGHGTHVAGTAAGTEFGIAKAATIVPVRVLGCTGSGSYSGIIAALDWVIANNPAGVRGVVSMSLGGGYSAALNTEIDKLVAAGIPAVVAAGNDGLDASSYSPASAASAITVGASDSTDTRASFSNYGFYLDIFAPGVGITSDDAFAVNGTQTWNGTSMATPHVSGVAAALLALQPTLTPAQVVSTLQANAIPGKVSNSLSTANYLLNSSFLTGGTIVVPVAPDAPTGLTSTSVAGTSVGLTWSAPVNSGTAAVSSYKVEWKKSSVTTWSSGSVTGTAATVSGLTSGTAYNFRVSAVSADGTSAASSVLNVTTLVVGTVPSAPRSPKVSVTYSNQLNLSWTVPSSAGTSPITGYKVQQLVSNVWNTVATSTSTSAAVTGLTANTSYSFRVLATNAVGDSLPSSTLTAKTGSGIPAKPGTPTVTVGSLGAVTVKWTTVPVVTFGTPITYRVEFTNSAGTTVVQTTVANTSPLTVTLARTTSYKVKVTALSGAIAGTASTLSSTFTTK